MNNVNPSDIFEIRRQSLFSERDRDYLGDLYLPIIGAKAYAIFLSLLSLKDGETSQHMPFFLKNGINANEFVSSLNLLEGIGLVKSFFREQPYRSFIYCLYAPLDPGSFLDNPLLTETLKGRIGMAALNSIIEKYKLLDLPVDYENISKSFSEVFKPELSVMNYQIGPTGKRVGGVPSVGFDNNVFFKEVADQNQDPTINQRLFAKKELKAISECAVLYGYTEATMVPFVMDNFDITKAFGSRLDIKGMSQSCYNSMHFASARKMQEKQLDLDLSKAPSRVIKELEIMTPVEFLTKMQHGNRPAWYDMELCRILTSEIGLSNCVCNALLFYMLSRYDGRIIRSVAERTGALLVRKNITTVLDAFDFFTELENDYSEYRKSHPAHSNFGKTNKSSLSAPKQEKTEDSSANNVSSDDDYDLFLKELEGA